MTKKLTTIEKTQEEPEVINGRVVPYHKRALNPDGSEKLNPISLVATVHLKPMSIGERIQRYLNTPGIDELQGYEGFYDDLEEMDPDSNIVNPMTPFEDRAFALQERSYERRRKEAEAAAQAKLEQEKERKAAFRRDLEALRAEAGELPGDGPVS